MGFKMYVDKEGVPYHDYGLYKGIDIGRQRSILAVAERGLWYWNEFNLSRSGEQVLLSYDWARWPINREQNPANDEAARTMLIHCADWLMNNLTDRGSHLLWRYDYPMSYGVQAGWGSAHAQAVGLQLLLRASELDGGSYMAPVEGLLRAFDVPIEDGGLLDNSNPQVPWFEKFASSESQRPKVLNGMLFTLLGLHDVANRTGLEAARRLYEVGLGSVLRVMDHYDLGDWSAYDIQGKPASLHYHHIHVEQLDRLFRIEGDIQLVQWRDKFASYQPPPGPEHDWLKAEVDNLQKKRDKLKKQLSAVKNSFSYRLGNMLVEAVYKPGHNTILLPCRLIRLCVTELKKQKILVAKHPPEPKSPQVKFTEVYLSNLPLSPSTCMVMENYVSHWGIQLDGSSVGRFGGHPLDDWGRIDYLSSLLPEGNHLLDVGCGGGRFLNLVASLRKFHNIIGVDIRRNKQFLTLSGFHSIEFVYASVETLPFSDKFFDVVACSEVLEHLSKDAFIIALNELRRVVNRLLIITVPYNEPRPLYGTHKLRFTDSDLTTYFPHGEFILLKKKPTGNAWVAILERS